MFGLIQFVGPEGPQHCGHVALLPLHCLSLINQLLGNHAHRGRCRRRLLLMRLLLLHGGFLSAYVTPGRHCSIKSNAMSNEIVPLLNQGVFPLVLHDGADGCGGATRTSV